MHRSETVRLIDKKWDQEIRLCGPVSAMWDNDIASLAPFLSFQRVAGTVAIPKSNPSSRRRECWRRRMEVVSICSQPCAARLPLNSRARNSMDRSPAISGCFLPIPRTRSLRDGNPLRHIGSSTRHPGNLTPLYCSASFFPSVNYFRIESLINLGLVSGFTACPISRCQVMYRLMSRHWHRTYAKFISF